MKHNSRCFYLFTLILLFGFHSSYSQRFHIINTLEGNDSYSFASLRMSKQDYEVALINNKGILKWQVPIPGLILEMGKFNNNLLVFYVKDLNEHHSIMEIKEIHAALVGIQQKKILSDKIVFINDEKYGVDPIVLDDPAGNFAGLIVRTTAAKKGGAFSYNSDTPEKQSETTALCIIFLDNDLRTDRKELNCSAIGGNYIAANADNGHNIYISSFSNDQLIVEKMDGTGKPVAKLSVRAPLRNKFPYTGISRFDTVSGNATDVLVRYENQDKKKLVRLFHFDFAAQKAIATPETALDRNYEKALKEAQAGKVKSSNLKEIDNLQPVQILETEDRIILLKEIQYTYSAAQKDAALRFSRGAGIISIYTKDLRLIKELVIDKTAETFLKGGNAMAGHLKDGKLYVVTCERGGIAAFKDAIYTINIRDGILSKKVLDRGDAGRSLFLNPVIFWYSDNFITPLEYIKAFFALKYTTILQSQSYP